MRVRRGMKAPDFTGHTVQGGEVSLESLRGRNVLLKFYRFASCPICNLHVRELVTRSNELSAAGLTTVLFYHSPAPLIERKVRSKVPFDLASDPAKVIFREYRVESSWRAMLSIRVWRKYMRAMIAGFITRPVGHEGGMTGHPADFLIDAEGIVRYAHYGTDYADSLSADEALKAASELGLATRMASPASEPAAVGGRATF
jgi:peroxiredoxin Q/BCP